MLHDGVRAYPPAPYVPPPPPPPPPRYDPEVRAAVDQEIAPQSTAEQRERGYVLTQAYVDRVGGVGDAGITAEALPARTSQLLEEASISTAAQQARVDAERVLATGLNDSSLPDWLPGTQGEDDYGARRNAFAEAMEGGTPAYRGHLMRAVLEEDPGAMGSWLKVNDIVALHDSGAIDDATFGTLAETTAGAYNDGVIDDASFEGFYNIDDPETQVRESDQLLAFLAASDGPETTQLRGDIAGNIVDQWARDPYPTDGAMHAYNFRRLSLAFEVAAGDPNHPELVTNLFNAQSPQVQDAILAVAGQVHTPADHNTLEGDLLVTLMNGASADSRPQGEALASRLARLPGEHPDWFSQDPISMGWYSSDQSERNGALATLLSSHDGAVLDSLTLYDDSSARGLGTETDRQQFEVNGRDLAAVMELTVFNPNIADADRGAAQDAFLAYARDQAQIIEVSSGQADSAGYEEASGRMLVMSAATEVAVDRGFESLQADIDAKKEAIAFVVDLALTAVPLPSRLSTGFSDQVGTLFADNPLIKEALTGLGGEAIDQVTGQLTDAAKEQLYSQIDSDPELAALVERSVVADAFKESLLGAVPDERDRAEIRRDANGLADDISELD
jgi:hypothetical protein